MMSLKKLSALTLTLAAGSAFAGPVVSFTSFGSFLPATFGGTGIPNNAVATSVAPNGVILGLSATPRYSSLPAPTNNGAGIFQAPTGDSVRPGLDPVGDNLAKWNFGFYIGGSGLTAYNYKLLGDFSAAVGNADTSYQDISAYLAQPSSTTTPNTIQNSGNLGFGTSFAQFNPYVAGEYGFILAAYDKSGGAEVGRTAILVNVSQVPEPGSLALVGLALAGLAGLHRRKV